MHPPKPSCSLATHDFTPPFPAPPCACTYIPLGSKPSNWAAAAAPATGATTLHRPNLPLGQVDRPLLVAATVQPAPTCGGTVTPVELPAVTVVWTRRTAGARQHAQHQRCGCRRGRRRVGRAYAADGREADGAAEAALGHAGDARAARHRQLGVARHKALVDAGHGKLHHPHEPVSRDVLGSMGPPKAGGSKGGGARNLYASAENVPRCSTRASASPCRWRSPRRRRPPGSQSPRRSAAAAAAGRPRRSSARSGRSGRRSHCP